MLRWLSSTWIECIRDCFAALGKAAWTVSVWVFRNSKDLIAFLSLAVGLAILGYLYSLAQQGVVEDFNVPTVLKEQGYTGVVVAQRLIDRFQEIRHAAGEGSGERISADTGLKDSLKLLEAELPVTFIVEMVRTFFRLPPAKIGGDIVVRTEAGAKTPSYEILLRIESEFCAPACVFKGHYSDVETGLTELSFQALGRVDPYNLAVYYLRRSDALEAERLIPDFMRQRSIPEADRLNVMGGILKRRGKIKAAKDAYCEAIREDPQDPSPHYNLAEVLRQEGTFPQAMREYQEAITLQNAIKRNDPKSLSDFYRGLGSGYQKQAEANTRESANLAAKALQNYLRAISLNSQNARAYAGWGSLLLKGEKVDDARAKYEESLKLDPNLVQGYLGIADCLRLRNQAAAAVEMYKRAIQVSEEHENSDEASAQAARKQVEILEQPRAK